MSVNNSPIRLHDRRVWSTETVFFDLFSYEPLTVVTDVLEQNYAPHRHNFFEVILAHGGEGKHVIDFEAYPHATPIVYVLSPGQVHYWDLQKPLLGTVLMFNEELLVSSGLGAGGDDQTFLQDLQETPAVALQHDQYQLLSSIASHLAAEHARGSDADILIIQGYMHILLRQLRRIVHVEGVDESGKMLVRRFKALAMHTLGGNKDVSFFASELGVSVTSLRAEVKRALGVSPGKYVRNLLLTEAKRLLVHSGLNAAEVAYSLGYADPSYFGRFFKRETGMSPKAFQQSISQSNRMGR